VGDSVTWTNRDEAPHTATGGGGSFNTGNLEQGQSGSHTFSSAGRFPYICALHPTMKGTVVVAGTGAGGGSGGDDDSASGAGSGSADPSATPGGTDASATGSSLPQTGFQVLSVVMMGAALMAAGSALRVIAR